ncbi:DUF4124 domain-containing protein [Pseudoduganella violacea]|uniref:Type IV secretory pathway VirB10-like protein n=1 Tax=Pseudoduganella violacea TaxID=1715466 RepID=A0A7W5BFH9_9BURK|nr:DUF4124 domain-containing protein [Pseudoduganella violacea]MBB3122214.1 type IV secretory pathway VirB10-like protein [Pseudoduganella violacea]
MMKSTPGKRFPASRQAFAAHGAALLAALLCWPALAQAQWVWLNERGVKQLSDQPPPPAVPNSRILKAPRGQMPEPLTAAPAADEAPTAEGEAAPAPDNKPRAKPTLAERNADYNKRRTEAAAAEQKTREETERQTDNAKNCDSIRANQRVLESGERAANYDKNGGRSFISDEQRAQQIKRNQQMLASGCK